MASEQGAVRVLKVYSNDEVVGWLTEGKDIWQFNYAQTWLDSRRGWDLSPALPREMKHIVDGATNRPVQWFFDNLLPEEGMRTAVAKQANLHEADAFALLQHLGAESAGSLVLLPDGVEPAEQEGWRDLSFEDLSQRIQSMPKIPIATTGPKRMSIAGAQHKLLVGWDGHSLKEPVGRTPSTHILKPENDSGDYSHSVINEYAMMSLAAGLGLEVPSVWRLYCPQPVYIVERFDRVISKSGCNRLHLIDACQLLNQARTFKYQSADVRTLSQVIEQTRTKIRTRKGLWRWLVFNVLIGNNDNHLKNISFLVDEFGMHLAPAYDLLSTAVYHTKDYGIRPGWPEVDLAIPLPGEPRYANLTRDGLMKAADEMRIPAAVALRELDGMRMAIQPKMDSIIEKIQKENEALPEQAQRYLGGELKLLRTIRHVVIDEMVGRLG